MARPLAVEQLELGNVVIKKNNTNKVVVDNIAQADASDISTINLRISKEEVQFDTARTSQNAHIVQEEGVFSTSRGSLNLRTSKEEVEFATSRTSLDLRSSKEEVEFATSRTSQNAHIEAEEGIFSTARSSLNLRTSKEEVEFATSRTSLDLRSSKEEVQFATARTSQNAHIVQEEGIFSTARSSLTTDVQAEETALSNALTSLDLRMSKEERTTQIVLGIPVTGQTSHRVIDFTNGGSQSNQPYAADRIPSAIAMLRETSGAADKPIIATSLSGAATHTGCTVMFSDDIPGTAGQDSTYVIDLILGAANPPRTDV